jgi:hypothetical protein
MVEHEDPAYSPSEVLDRACTLAGMVAMLSVEQDYPDADADGRRELADSYDFFARVYFRRHPQAHTAAEHWHWRARQVEAFFPDPSVDDIAGAAADKRKGHIRRLLGGTVLLFGRPYEELTFREFSVARSIALERHYALNWLWDGAPWDEVLTDT